MRALRMSLIGTVVLALLGGLSVVVVAQTDEGGPGYAAVTGIEECSWISDGIEELQKDGVERYRGEKLVCTLTTGDPRLRGSYSNTLDSDCYPDIGCLGWGEIDWIGPGGWAGSYRGWVADDDEAVNQWYAVWEGLGSNSGWTFVGVGTGDPEIWRTRVEGVMYEGPPPEWDPPATAAE